MAGLLSVQIGFRGDPARRLGFRVEGLGLRV